MGEYTLRAVQADGCAVAAKVHECRDNAAAYERAADMLAALGIASAVEVWRLSELVLTVKRQSRPITAQEANSAAT